MNALHRLASLAAVPALALLSAGPAHADQLATIKERGKLICGTLGTVPPFNFQDAGTRQIVGYDISLCELVAKEIGVPHETKVISAPARIPELRQGGVDIVTGSFGWTPERAQQVDYSHAYYETISVLGVRRGNGLASWADLAGKRVGAPPASTSSQAAKEKLPDSTHVTFGDVPQTLLALRQKKVDAIALNELILSQYQRQSEGSADAIDLIVEPPLLLEKYGIGVKQGESALLDTVNRALVQADQSGEIDRLFNHWLGKDTPYGLTRKFTVAPIASR